MLKLVLERSLRKTLAAQFEKVLAKDPTIRMVQSPKGWLQKALVEVLIDQLLLQGATLENRCTS